MITNTTPDTWQHLQVEVARVLEECGFAVEIEKKTTTVRGDVELDVYAEEEIKGRRYSIICECKHWKARVPQNVVHGFRTTVADIGVNAGYVISMAGFQEGAYRAAEKTNTQLVTWVEFQNAFEKTWYEAFFYPQITARLDPLLTYAEPLFPRWFDQLTDEDQDRYIALNKKYQEFGWLMMSFTTYARHLRKDDEPKLPLIERLPPNTTLRETLPQELLNVATPREFFNAAVEYGEHAIQLFRAIRDEEA